jgi:hypothetical protein
MLLRMMRQEFASSWWSSPLQKWTIHIIRLTQPSCDFWAFSKIKKKMPCKDKSLLIILISQRDNITGSYYGKRFGNTVSGSGTIV